MPKQPIIEITFNYSYNGKNKIIRVIITSLTAFIVLIFLAFLSLIIKDII